MNINTIISSGRTLVVENTLLRTATWQEKMWRWIHWNGAKTQDKCTENHLIDILKNHSKDDQTIKAISKFLKGVNKTHHSFKNLENHLFAIKCQFEIPSLQLQDLIDTMSQTPTALFQTLQVNHLHHVIPKANDLQKCTALIIIEKGAFIRSPQGNSFLDTPEHINSLIDQLPKNHPDREKLLKLHQLIQRAEEHIEEIQILRQELEPSYKYVPLSDIQTNDKGVWLSQSYLADGVEGVHHSQWTNLKPYSREEICKDSPKYRLRIVTKYPAYSLGKSQSEKIFLFVKSIFNFRAHGHSWIELVEPINDEKGNLTQQQNVFNVGYYFHILSKHKRLESPDPMSYMPMSLKAENIEEIDLTKEQFEKAKFYIEETQKLFLSPHRNLTSAPEDIRMSVDDYNRICYLYKSSFKGTCLRFCTALKEITTQEKFDKPSLAVEVLDHLLERTKFLKELFRIPQFIKNMALPAFVTRANVPDSILRRHRSRSRRSDT